MSDEMQIDGENFISSKQAAKQTGYAQDYIGQLSRKSLIDARRIGGLWYVSLDSLEAYKKKADEYKPQPPTRAEVSAEPGTLVFFDGNEYLSALRAAEITGYTQDYVGQLARAGAILSKLIGNRWYVEKESILAHKSEKDGLLAAVQSASVGLLKPSGKSSKAPEYLSNASHSGSEPLLNYVHEDADLLPLSEKKHDLKTGEPQEFSESFGQRFEISTSLAHAITIKKVSLPAPTAKRLSGISHMNRSSTDIKREESTLPLLLAAAATIVIVVSVGYASILKQNSVYAANTAVKGTVYALPASVEEAFGKIGDMLEPLLTRQLTYTRTQ